MKSVQFAAALALLPVSQPSFAATDYAAVPRNATACSHADLAALCRTEVAAQNFADRKFNRYEYAVAEVETRRISGGNRLVLLSLCERTACNQSTHSTTVAVFGATGKLKMHKNISGDAEFASADGSSVTVRTNDYGPNDPTCCPSLVRLHRLRF